MNAKKTAIAAVSYAMVAALAIGGTLAYQADTDYDVNTMSLGDVDIVQNEYQRVDDKENQTKLEDFKQLKEVKPAYYKGTSIPYASGDQWVVPNDEAWKVVEDNPAVIDKFITVKNVGSDAAYVRTIIAFEVGKDGVNDPYMHLVHNDAKTSNWDFKWLKDSEDVEKDLHVEIGDGTFALGVYTYKVALNPNEETVPTVKQIYLGNTATNEVVKAYGETFEIYAFTQAVQTDLGTADGALTPAESLNAAFGEISAANHPWTETAFVDSAEELSAAIEKGGEVVLTGDITLAKEGVKVTTDTSINLNGFDIESEGDIFIVEDDATLTIEGEGTLTAGCGVDSCAVWADGGHAILKGGTYVGSYDDEKNGNDTIYTKNGGTVEVWDGTYTAYHSSMKQCNCLNENDNNRGTITVYGGTFKEFNPADNLSEGPDTNFVADGYSVVESTIEGETWYTVVAK